MPITRSSISFADEFNTGSVSTLTNAVLGDIWTATIGIYFENIIDADQYAGLKIYADNTSNLLGYGGTTGKQFIFIDSSLASYYNEQYNEYQNLIGAEIQLRDGSGTLGTYTVDSLFFGLYKGVNGMAVICSDNVTLTNKTYNDGKLVVTEAITSGQIGYAVSNTSNNNDYTPTIEINSSQTATWATSSATLDATNTGSPVSLAYKFSGAYETGSLTIDGNGIANDRQSFIIVHTFKIVPISIFIDGSTTEPSDFNGRNNSKYNNLFSNGSGQGAYRLNSVFSNQLTGGISISSVTTSSSNNIVDELPNVAIFDETYLGFNTDYSITNFTILRTSDSEVADVPLVDVKFTVSFDIENATSSPFSNSNTKVKVGIENLNETIDNSEDYIQTYLSDYAITTLGAGAVAGSATGDAASITNYTATYNSATSVSISFDVDFTANGQTQIDANSEPYFSIYAVTQNHTLDYTNSDRSILNVFRGVGISNVLLDPITEVSTQFITAPYDDLATGIDASEIDGFPVQLICGITRFSADWSTRPDLRIDTISQNLVLKNSVTLEEIELDTTSIPVSTFNLIDGEYPNANYSALKGYKIPSSEVRNKIQVYNRFDLDSGDVHYYECVFPFFIRWEYYKQLILTSIPPSIIDTAEDFDGVNYDVYRIDALTNWSLNYRTTFNCSEGSTTFEQDFDYTIPTSDYNSHPDITARSITSFKEDGVTALNGLIESTEKTLIVAEFTYSVAPSAISDFEIELYIEAYENGSPTKIQRISSINSLLSGSWWTDTGAGDGLVLKSIDGSKAVGKAYIDNSILVNYDNYTIYATIYDPKRPTEYLLAENGDNLTDELGNKFIRDF